MESLKIVQHRHPLRIANLFILYPNGWWYCDICKRHKNQNLVQDEKGYHCYECGYDACRECIIKIVEDSFGYNITQKPDHLIRRSETSRKNVDPNASVTSCGEEVQPEVNKLLVLLSRFLSIYSLCHERGQFWFLG